MTAATTLTIPIYDMSTATPSVVCAYAETFTFEVNGVASDLTAYADWFTVSGKTVTLVVSDANRDAIGTKKIEVTVVNTLNDAAVSVSKTFKFTVTVLRADCEASITWVA